MFEKMRRYIADQLAIAESDIQPDSSFRDDLGADSLDLFEMVMNLEEEYSIEISPDDLASMNRVSDVIDYLKNRKNITVVTNSVPAIQLLHNYGIPVKCTGGDLNDESMGFVGYAAESYLTSIRTDFAFISTPAIGLDGRISDYSEQETHLRKVALANSAHSVYLFEKQKLNQSAIFTLCNITDINYLISNTDLAAVFRNVEIRENRNDPEICIAKIR